MKTTIELPRNLVKTAQSIQNRCRRMKNIPEKSILMVIDQFLKETRIDSYVTLHVMCDEDCYCGEQKFGDVSACNGGCMYPGA